MSDFELARDGFGRLVLRLADGSEHVGVVPVRAFPIRAPGDGVALMGEDGHERLWLARLDAAPAAARALIEEELAQREFMPEITRLVSVSGYATPSDWRVETDRGEAVLRLKGEDDIRRIGPDTLLISDAYGVNFLIRARSRLDRHSLRLLARFL